MPRELPKVKADDPITDVGWNDMVDQVNGMVRIRGGRGVRIGRNFGGVQIDVDVPPLGRWFKLTQDTPSGQGYVTARWLFWDSSQYDTDSSQDEVKIYDVLSGLAYGGTSRVSPSQWTKKDFLGRAVWDATRGEYVIEWIEHIARFINFTLTADLSSSQPTPQANVSGAWDGLMVSTALQGITLVGSAGWTAKSGATGTAVWRDDLNNSTKWQYQIIDLDITCENTTTT